MNSYREMINFLLHGVSDEQLEINKDELLGLAKHYDEVLHEY
jgi:hypothetical protein